MKKLILVIVAALFLCTSCEEYYLFSKGYVEGWESSELIKESEESEDNIDISEINLAENEIVTVEEESRI